MPGDFSFHNKIKAEGTTNTAIAMVAALI